MTQHILANIKLVYCKTYLLYWIKLLMLNTTSIVVAVKSTGKSGNAELI